MSDCSQTINILFKSRRNLLELMKYQNYDTTNSEINNINEINQMFINNQLDMLVEKKDKKTYIKYHLGKTLRRENINDYIDDLFNLEQVLSKKDTLIIVLKMEPNDTLVKCVNQIWEEEGIFIILYNIDRLQYNILDHELVPPHTVIEDDNELKEIKNKYNVMNNDQFPKISRFDPVAMAIGIRPNELCKITRSSKTAIESNYYRICS
jgi:DNA-directed RNA polymerase subunit H (RpoH/RPB5)